MNLKRVLLVGAVAASMSMAACTQVHPGHVGIVVNQLGGGVSNDVKTTGYVFTPPGTSVYEYPIFTNTYTFTANKDEQNGADESFPFQDNSGLGLSADVGVSYSVDPTLAPRLFQKYRVDTDGIIQGPLRNAIRSSLIEHAAQMQVQDIYGPKKQQLLDAVQADVHNYFAPYGLNIERLFWAGQVRVPQSVLDQINARVANEQEALAAQAQVATKTAEAQQKVATAQGEAQAILVVKNALDQAGPGYLEYYRLKQWDGHLPQVTGGGSPFISLSNQK